MAGGLRSRAERGAAASAGCGTAASAARVERLGPPDARAAQVAARRDRVERVQRRLARRLRTASAREPRHLDRGVHESVVRRDDAMPTARRVRARHAAALPPDDLELLAREDARDDDVPVAVESLEEVVVVVVVARHSD